MNNRYFGNIHDFYKYALLRLLVGLLPLGEKPKEELFDALGVCWMLTRDDDPEKSGVGQDGDNFGSEAIDKNLHSKFREWREQGELRKKGVGLLHSSGLLRNAKFFIDEMGREKYFEDMRGKFKDDKRDLIFFDPDYGLALGARDWGPGFLPASEVDKCYESGFSVMFYHSQYGAQPDSGRLIRGELRRAFGGILPPVYAIGGGKKAAGLAGSHAAAGDISPMFFLMPQSGKRDDTRKFLSDFRAHMWRHEDGGDVFTIPGRIGMFVDYDNVSDMDKIRCVRREAVDKIGWRDELSDQSGIFWNGNTFRQHKVAGEKWRAKEPKGLPGLPVVNTGGQSQSADAEISARIRACVENGEVDAVVLYTSDKDHKLDAAVAKKHGVRFLQVLNDPNANKKNYGRGRQLFVVKKNPSGDFKLEEVK